MACLRDSPEFDALSGIKCEINTEMDESHFDSDLAAASSNIIDGRNIRCEEMLEDISLKQDLRVKQEVGEDGDTMLQPDISCKQEIKQEVDNIPGTLSRDEISQDYSTDSEEKQFPEVGASFKCESAVENDESRSIDVKEEVSPPSLYTSTNTLDVSRKVQSDGELKQLSRPTGVELESTEDNDSELSVEPDDIIDCASSLMISSMLILRACFVNLGKNNVLYNSQQHNGTGKVKRTIRRSQKKGRELQKCLSASDCASLPKVNIDQRSDCKTRSARYVNVGVQHKRTKKKTYQCDECPYTASLKNVLVRHKRIHTGEKPYQCDKCPYAALHVGNLAQHKRIHTGEKPYQCDKCPYAASRATLLVRHKRKHTGEKPYQCDKCPYTTSWENALVQHKRIHTGEKPYQCDKCPYAAAQAGTLLVHKRKHTGEKPYQCDKCHYATAESCNLVTHKRIHTGEKPYQCDKCPYAAAESCKLVRHKRIHTGEKPYQCDKCPFAAARASNLVTHKRQHTGEKPYRCDKCPYATADAGNLVRHKRKHTDE